MFRIMWERNKREGIAHNWNGMELNRKNTSISFRNKERIFKFCNRNPVIQCGYYMLRVHKENSLHLMNICLLSRFH